MKKIFAVSLIAMTAVTAANAEIASKAYVDQQDEAIDAKITILNSNASTTGSVAKSIADAIGTLPGNASTVAQAITASNSTVANLDYAGAEGDGVVTQVTQADGLVGATKTKITTSHIASDAGIVATQLAQGVQTSLGYADDWNTTKATYGNIVTHNASEFETAGTAAGLVGTVPSGYSNVIGYVDSVAGTAGTAVQTSSVKDTYSSSSGDPISGKGVAAAIEGLSLGTMSHEAAADYKKTADLDSSASATTKQVVTGVTMTDGAITVSSADPLTNAAYDLQTTNQGAGKYALTAVYNGETLSGYKWELIQRATPGSGS